MKSLFKLSLVVSACLLFCTLFSCEKDPIIQTEIVTVTDTIMITTVDTVLVNTTDTVFLTTVDTVLIDNDEETTTFVLIRHAETLSNSNNPGLSVDGLARVARLVDMLSVLDLDRIYSTNFNRTTETALPIAQSQDLALSTYGGFDHDFVIDDILDNQKGGIVLIVGHSNTTPNFLNALTGTMDFPDLAENSYDNFFIVNTKSKGDSEVVHLKY